MNNTSYSIDLFSLTSIMRKGVYILAKTRVPIQKRSIEKKQKILDAGFELFCKKGYYKTNTIEIAKHAGVSTGAVYSYFKDKREIYIAAFEDYLDNLSGCLFEELEAINPFTLENFVDKWLTSYIELYATSSHALALLRVMIIDDSEINHHFSASESNYFTRLVEFLEKNGIYKENIIEKIYACCVLVDTLRQEKSVFSHSELNFTVFTEQVKDMILKLLSS